MDAVNNRQIPTNYSQNSANVSNDVRVNNAPPAAGPGGGNNVEQGSLSGPGAAGEMAYADASLNGSDWGALLDSVQAANLSVTVTAIMVLLVEIMAQMKQDAREEAFTQAQATVAAGELAAQKMKDAAEDTLLAAQVSAGVQIGMGVLQAVGGAVQLGKISSFNSQQSALTKQNNQLQAMTEGRATVAPPLDFAPVSASLQAQTQVLNGVTSVGNSIATLVSEFMKRDAAIAQAESQEARANADYQQALGQAAQAFMQQVADAIKAFLNTMQSVDQAQHKATGAIYNC
jgi:hypothetical protein